MPVEVPGSSEGLGRTAGARYTAELQQAWGLELGAPYLCRLNGRLPRRWYERHQRSDCYEGHCKTKKCDDSNYCRRRSERGYKAEWKED